MADFVCVRAGWGSREISRMCASSGDLLVRSQDWETQNVGHAARVREMKLWSEKDVVPIVWMHRVLSDLSFDNKT